ncbi:NAD(P)H-quinone oxidoreductase [Shewanella maritima]|uniref:NAD(P)H-quinone oxidoreductase n=1 Tax=Shewanella maritima TaxID=2520507 RepID=UPI00373566A6
MKYVTYSDTGTADVLYIANGAKPTVLPGQVLIKVAAAGVNGPDIKQRQGAYPAPAGASPILGLEVSGAIVSLGDGVTHWQLDQQVCALVPGGGYAEYVVTDARHCLPIPKGMSLVHGASLPETLFTVWGNLFMRAGLCKGESVLIHGGSGGIGTTAIQLAKAMGAKVYATSSTDEKLEYCLAQGADFACNYQQDFVEPILEANQGQGIDVVFDMAGGEFINQNLKLLAMDGRMVSVAMQAGAKATVDVFRIMAKRITWTGSTLRPQSNDAKAEIAKQLQQHVWPLLDNGKMAIHVDQVFGFEQVVSAHQRMESGRHRGKLVLDWSSKN